MDIAFFGDFKYLIVVGTNNRYVWAIEILNKEKETIKAALVKLLNFETFREKFPIFIDCDGEKGFAFLNLDPDVVIIKSKPNKFHNRLSIINRVIRTLRDYAYKAYKTTKDITPERLSQIVEHYNNYPHKTLSRLIGFNVSPRMVLFDLELEAFIAKKLFNTNMKERKKKLEIGTNVMLCHPKKAHEKIRFIMEPGIYTVIDYENGMYEIEAEDKNKQVVPGFYLVKL
jgi:hypothetical protein